MNTMLAAIFAAAAALTPAPDVARGATNSYTLANAGLACTVMDKRETRYRGKHLFLCLSALGEIKGAFLNPNGTVHCTISGTRRYGCTSITGCVSSYTCGG